MADNAGVVPAVRRVGTRQASSVSGTSTLTFLLDAAFLKSGKQKCDDSGAVGSRPLPEPGFGPTVELLGGDPRHVVNLRVAGKALSSQRFVPEQAPPGFL